ncbi:hypothetical protein AN641_06045 [Candidatus Epulonipiscioides gigas]|nr:hypothetical protein AN641_06045 [Epulopiscium sp. SCG-C07WGA-EpuloA2]
MKKFNYKILLSLFALSLVTIASINITKTLFATEQNTSLTEREIEIFTYGNGFPSDIIVNKPIRETEKTTNLIRGINKTWNGYLSSSYTIIVDDHTFYSDWPSIVNDEDNLGTIYVSITTNSGVVLCENYAIPVGLSANLTAGLDRFEKYTIAVKADYLDSEYTIKVE